MATYKVPQDVEAEDKLIGFLSLKQFIFVIIMVAALWMCWILAKVNIVLGLIPLPIALVSGVLGLYQRRDQPVEIYLASWLRFKTKPRTRKWDQEGLEERVIITAPKVTQKNYTKGLTEEQVSSRLSQLSSMLDSRGWASKQMVSALPAQDDQRLFSMQELSRYSHASIPLDTDNTSVVDPYDKSDPRNRTSQEVTRDFTKVSTRQHNNALEVVERARREAGLSKPQPQPAPISNPISTPRVQATKANSTQAPSPNTQASSASKPAQRSVQQIAAQPKTQIVEPNQADQDSSEVIIDLHHKK